LAYSQTLDKSLYQDLDLNFTAHPNTQKLTILSGNRAVTRSIRNLLMTQHYEKPFHPEIGSHVTSYLFENVDEDTASKLQIDIEAVLNNYEPRITLNNVTVHVDPDQNGFYVTLYYFIKSQPREQISEIFLERVR